MQRLVIIASYSYEGKRSKLSLSWKHFRLIAPYSFVMCSTNILSSFCVTIMPLAAFMAFKKFVVFFVLIVGIVMGAKDSFNKTHYWCIGFIVLGGLLIGEKDIFRGELIGYASSILYTLFEAISLQYASYLWVGQGIGPKGI